MCAGSPSLRGCNRHLLRKSCRDRGSRIGAPGCPGQSSETAERSSPLSDSSSRSNAGFVGYRLPVRRTRRSCVTTTRKSLASTDRAWFRTKGAPCLCTRSRAWRARRHVSSYRSRGHANIELNEKFRGNPFLTPCRSRHRGNELPQVRWNRWPARRPRFQPPTQASE